MTTVLRFANRTPPIPVNVDTFETQRTGTFERRRPDASPTVTTVLRFATIFNFQKFVTLAGACKRFAHALPTNASGRLRTLADTNATTREPFRGAFGNRSRSTTWGCDHKHGGHDQKQRSRTAIKKTEERDQTTPGLKTIKTDNNSALVDKKAPKTSTVLCFAAMYAPKQFCVSRPGDAKSDEGANPQLTAVLLFAIMHLDAFRVRVQGLDRKP